MRWPQIAVLMTLLFMSDGAATASAPEHETAGLASWYGGKFHGRATANGEVFDTNALTAAHRTLPFGSIVKVIHDQTGAEVIVRINDRGPFVDGRVIDLSRAAAEILGIAGLGVAPVTIEILQLAVEPQYRTLQLGAFAVRANATAAVEALGAHGINGAIETTATGVHRVIVQGVHVGELETMAERLAEIGYVNILVRAK